MNFKIKKGKFKELMKIASTEIEVMCVKIYLHTFNDKEIVRLLTDFINDTKAFDFIKINILKRINIFGIKPFNPFISKIINTLPIPDYKREKKKLSFLNDILEKLNNNQCSKIFFKLINSEKKINKNFALKVANHYYDCKIEKTLLEKWTNSQDQSVLYLLITHNAINIVEHKNLIVKLISSNKLNNWNRNQLLIIFAKENIENVAFLKESEPLTYLYILNKLNLKLDIELLNKLVDNISKSDPIGLIMWYLAKSENSKLYLEVFKKIKTFSP